MQNKMIKVNRYKYLQALKTLYMQEYPFVLTFTKDKYYEIKGVIGSDQEEPQHFAPCYLVVDDSGHENLLGGEFLKNFKFVPLP